MRKRRLIYFALVFVVLIYPCWFIFTQSTGAFLPIMDQAWERGPVQGARVDKPIMKNPHSDGVKIVFYTKVYNSDEWNFLAPCPEHRQCSIGWERCQRVIDETNCTATFNASEVDTADVVVFDGPQYFREHDTIPLPKRYPYQLWAVLDKEASISSPIMAVDSMLKMFNMSITYRLSSEAWFGYVDPPSLETMFEFPMPISMKKKDVPAVWIASNCDMTSWPRSGLVQALMEHIKVDSYGTCLHNKDFTPQQLAQNVTSLQLVSQYKFYLAFENSQCDDYVTEKYFRALMAGAIPIVVGAPNIARFAPNNHSIIIVSDFESPEAIGNLVNRINNDDELYRHYVSWKLDKKVSKEFESLWTERLAGCMLTSVCDYAHKVKTGKIKHNPYHHPQADTSCLV